MSFEHVRPDWPSLIVEGIEEALFTLDRAWRLTYVNAQASNILGLPQAALLGTVIWESFPDLIGSTFEHLYRQAMAEGMAARSEDFYPSRQAWYDVRVYPIPQGLIVYFQDSTLQNQTEAQIQRQAERARVQAEVSRTLAEVTYNYQMTLDTAARQLADVIGDSCIIRLLSSDGAWFEVGSFHHRNPEAAELLRGILTEERYARVHEELAGQVVQTGQPLVMPTFSSAQAKASMHARHWPYFDRFPSTSMIMVPLRATGRVIGVASMNRLAPSPSYTEDDLLFLQDLADRMAIAITNARLLQQVQHELVERIQVEADLRASEERFKILSEATNEAILIHEHGRIVEANQRAAEMLGYPFEELIGLAVETVVAPEHRAALRDRIMHNHEFTTTAIGLRKDGTRLTTEVRGRSIEYQGRPMRLKAIRDVTDLKHAEDVLHKTQAQLLQSQKMESMGQLAGGIAHDFNNLLSVIIGYCDLILAGLDETDPLYTDVYEILKAGNRAVTLVRQILAFSRQQVLEPHVINLNNLVQNMDALLHRALGEDIELVSLLEPDLDLVLLDPGQVEQVIVNLAVNARDAMPEGGLLTIETANVDLDEHYRSTGHPEVKTGAYVMLAVSDTGIGMDQVTQAKIFEPFFTTKMVGKGTGLGLATVYGIVRQSEGYIWVYSEPEVGTTFKVYFPMVADLPLVPSQTLPEAQVQRSAALPTSAHPGHGRTILVVEDDALVRDLIHRVLVQSGYTILEAHNGRAALDTLATYARQVDLVLTDIVMPELGGRALAERLKEEWADIKVLCMSGYADHAVRRHGILRPCDTFLQKPFTPETLLRQIDEVLNTIDNQYHQRLDDRTP